MTAPSAEFTLELIRRLLSGELDTDALFSLKEGLNPTDDIVSAVGNIGDGVNDAGNPVGIGLHTLTAAAAALTNGQRGRMTGDPQRRLFTRGAHQLLPDETWWVSHVPAVGSQAIATQAAPGAGKRLVVTWFHANLGGETPAPAVLTPVLQFVEDVGGTPNSISVIVTSTEAAAGRQTNPLALSNIWMKFAQNKSVSIRFNAGATDVWQSVLMGGVTVAE